MSSRQDDQGGQPARQPVSASATPGNARGAGTVSNLEDATGDLETLPF